MGSCKLLGVDGLRQRGANSASGPASVGRDLTVPLVSALSWMGVAAVRAAPDKLESHATRGTCATHTRACTVTSPQTSQDTRLECVHVSGPGLLLYCRQGCNKESRGPTQVLIRLPQLHCSSDSWSKQPLILLGFTRSLHLLSYHVYFIFLVSSSLLHSWCPQQQPPVTVRPVTTCCWLLLFAEPMC